MTKISVDLKKHLSDQNLLAFLRTQNEELKIELEQTKNLLQYKSGKQHSLKSIITALEFQVVELKGGLVMVETVGDECKQ